MDNLIGKKLDGRYQLEELIGSGGEDPAGGMPRQRGSCAAV